MRWIWGFAYFYRAVLSAVLALGPLCLLVDDASAQQTAAWGTVAGWEIRVDRSIGDGCYAYQPYEDGTTVRMGFDNEKKTIYLVLGNAAWKSLEIGKAYRLQFLFDETSKYSGDFKGIRMGDGKVVFLDGDNLSYDFTVDFMQRNHVRLYYEGSQIAHLSLANTFAAIGEVVKCQESMGGLKDTQDPFRSTRSPSSPQDPFSR
jgi:hypothetical protein